MSGRDRMMRKIREEAKSHREGCGCDTCRAAAGDEQAKRKLLRELL